MDSDIHPDITMAAILKRTLQVWLTGATVFLLLMGLVVAAVVLMEAFVIYVIGPHRSNPNLREIWLGMGFLEKLAIVVLFFVTLGVQHRALAASIFATQEIWNRGDVRFWQAIGFVTRKQLRLFWIAVLSGLVTGPLGLIVGPILLFATSPGIPVAVLEGKAAIASVRRGDTLFKRDHGKVAILVLLFLGMGVAAALGLLELLIHMPEHFGRPLPPYLWLVPAMGFWLALLIPQLYVIALTLIYLERKAREADGTAAIQTETQVAANA